MEQAEVLRAGLPNLGDSDRKFSESLLRAFDRRKATEKQLYWIGRMAQRVTAPPPTPVQVTGGLSAVYRLLETAAPRLKWPKVQFDTTDGRTIRLHVAGPQAKRPGTITVTQAVSFGKPLWHGRIDRDGKWDQPRNGVPETVVEAVTALAVDPAGFMGAYGRRTGNCGFCLTPLTDERSVAVGYGRVCAGHYDLPWGAKAKAEADAQAAQRAEVA